MKREEEQIPGWVIVLVVVLIFVGLLIYLLSLGSVDLGYKNSFPDEFKEDRQKALERHRKLKELVLMQVELKRKLDRKFRLIYLSIRILFILAWTALLFGFYYLGFVNDIGDVLNFTEASLILVFTLNFLCFGSLKNLDSTLQYIKARLENWIYGKYVTVQKKIDRNQMEIFQIEKEHSIVLSVATSQP